MNRKARRLARNILAEAGGLFKVRVEKSAFDSSSNDPIFKVAIKLGGKQVKDARGGLVFAFPTREAGYQFKKSAGGRSSGTAAPGIDRIKTLYSPEPG